MKYFDKNSVNEKQHIPSRYLGGSELCLVYGGHDPPPPLFVIFYSGGSSKCHQAMLSLLFDKDKMRKLNRLFICFQPLYLRRLVCATHHMQYFDNKSVNENRNFHHSRDVPTFHFLDIILPRQFYKTKGQDQDSYQTGANDNTVSG